MRGLVLLLAFAAAGCNRQAVCPTNQSNVAKDSNGKPPPPAKPSGTYDRNGRFVKKNAYHPSHYAGGK